MNYCVIEDRNNIIYPFSKDIYENPYIVYHGTSSCYSENIEALGWPVGGTPYELEDVRKIVQIHKEIELSNEGYRTISCFSELGKNSWQGQKTASFTNEFWYARNYSRNEGGETVANLIMACEQFIDIISSKQNKEEHMKRLAQKIVRNPGPADKDRYARGISRLLDEESLRRSLIVAKRVLDDYMRFAKSSHPVVYALEVNPDWLKEWKIYLESDRTHNYMRDIDMASRTDIPADCIISKVDYANGTERWVGGTPSPCPLPWLIGTNRVYFKGIDGKDFFADAEGITYL